MCRRLSDDRGFTVAEAAVAMFVGAVLLGALSTLLVVASRTGAFTEGQSATLNNARNAMQQLEREVRGADFIKWCAPTGSCLEIGVQTPSSTFQTVRYTHTAEELRREIYDDATSQWSAPQTLVSRVVNEGAEPVFECDTGSTLLHVNIDLKIEPTPVSDPHLNMATSVRPRNFPTKSGCP